MERESAALRVVPFPSRRFIETEEDQTNVVVLVQRVNVILRTKLKNYHLAVPDLGDVEHDDKEFISMPVKGFEQFNIKDIVEELSSHLGPVGTHWNLYFDKRPREEDGFSVKLQVKRIPRSIKKLSSAPGTVIILSVVLNIILVILAALWMYRN
jgi:hypothetical protein